MQNTIRILLLPAYFAPEQMASSHLNKDRYDAFCNAGFELEVYTPTPTRNVSNDIREKYKKIKNEVTYDGHMHIHRFAMYREGRNPVLRALRYFLCFIKQLYYGLTVSDIDVVYLASTPPIQGILGGIIKKIRKRPFVYNLQDIFPDSLVGTGLAKRNGILWKIGRIIENYTYRSADKIIVISDDFKKNIMAKGVPEDKIEVIYNWIDDQMVLPVLREENKLFDTFNLDRSKFYVSYCGNIGLTQNLDLLLEIAKELEPIDSIQFILIGEGAYKEKLEAIIKRNNISNIKLYPFQPYEDISYVFSLADAGLVISKPGVGLNSVPSKTWSILSASRPVLANFDENELKDIIETNKCGIFTKAGDKDALKSAIIKLYNDREFCVSAGKNGRDFVSKHLNKYYATQKYVDVIKSVVS